MIILLILLLVPSQLSAGGDTKEYPHESGVPFTTKLTHNNTQIIRNGTIFGLTSAPVDDKYIMSINNIKNHKSDSYSILVCRVRLTGEQIKPTKDCSNVLETIYYNKIGNVSIATGFVSNSNKYPKEDYKLIITNSKYVNKWNVLECDIK